MAQTYELFPGDGVQTDFNFEFAYLSRNYVKVSVDGVDTPFTFLDDFTVRLTPAPAVGTDVRVYRQTDRENLITRIPTTGSFTGDQINLQSQQALDVSEEAFDALDDTLSENLSGDLDASDRKIVNVSAPEDATDAANKSYVDNKFASDVSAVEAGVQAAQVAASSASDSKDAAALIEQSISDIATEVELDANRAEAAAASVDIGSGSDFSIDPEKLAKRGDVGDAINLAKIAPSVAEYGSVGTTDDTATFAAAAAASEAVFVPSGTYVLSSVGLYSDVTFICAPGVIFKRKDDSVGTGSYWVAGVGLFEINYDGFNVRFLGNPTFDMNSQGQSNLSRVNPGTGTITEPACWAIKYGPQSQGNTDDNFLLIEEGRFKNGITGYLLLRGADNNRNFRTRVVLDNPLMTDCITGYGKGDPATPTSVGWNADYILLEDYIDLITYDLTARYDAGPTVTGEYAPCAIRGTYFGTSSTSGGASAYLFGKTVIYGMGRKGELYDGSSPINNNGLGAIDFYGNTDTLYCQYLDARDCEVNPYRCKTDCNRFEIAGGYLENNKYGGINVSNAALDAITDVYIRNICVNGGGEPHITVSGVSGSTKLRKAVIQNVWTTGGENQALLDEGSELAAIYCRYVTALGVKNATIDDAAGNGALFRDISVASAYDVSVDGADGAGIVFLEPTVLASAKDCHILNVGGIGISASGSASVNYDGNVVDTSAGYGMVSTSTGYSNMTGGNHVANVSGNSRGYYIANTGAIDGNSVGSGVTTPAYPAFAPNVTQHSNSWNPTIVYNFAAPTTGTWKRMDICYNTGPTASGNVGWICVTAGTPGTWKSFGTIGA